MHYGIDGWLFIDDEYVCVRISDDWRTIANKLMKNVIL